MAVLHPDGFVEDLVASRKTVVGMLSSRRNSSMWTKPPGWILPSAVFVGAKVVSAVVYIDVFVDVVEEDCALNGWDERGDQQAVVTTSVNAGNGAGRIAADAVGDQPLFVQSIGRGLYRFCGGL